MQYLIITKLDKWCHVATTLGGIYINLGRLLPVSHLAQSVTELEDINHCINTSRCRIMRILYKFIQYVYHAYI